MLAVSWISPAQHLCSATQVIYVPAARSTIANAPVLPSRSIEVSSLVSICIPMYLCTLNYVCRCICVSGFTLLVVFNVHIFSHVCRYMYVCADRFLHANKWLHCAFALAAIFAFLPSLPFVCLIVLLLIYEQAQCSAQVSNKAIIYTCIYINTYIHIHSIQLGANIFGLTSYGHSIKLCWFAFKNCNHIYVCICICRINLRSFQKFSVPFWIRRT